MAKTVHARTLPVQSIDYKYGKVIIPPYEVDIEFTPQEQAALESGINANMIPSAAGANNPLADLQYVDDAVSEYSAHFLGTSAPGLTEQEFLEWADSLEKDNNDYCNWLTTDTDNKTIYKRYKYTGTLWLYEYDVADPSSIPTALSLLSEDTTHRVVTDTEKSDWNGKADSSDIPTKLSQLSGDATHRLVTDVEKATWNGKAEVGTSQDTPSEDTIYGAKAYAASLSLISVVALTSDVTSECSITGVSNSGRQQTIVYTNSSGSDKTVTVSATNYSTPDGLDIELTCPDGGYCEVSYLNVEGVIFARGV